MSQSKSSRLSESVTQWLNGMDGVTCIPPNSYDEKRTIAPGITNERARSPQRLSSFFHEGWKEVIAEWFLASQRVKRCRCQLEIYEIDDLDADSPARKVITSHRLQQCRELLRLYELDCERLTKLLQWLKSRMAAFAFDSR